MVSKPVQTPIMQPNFVQTHITLFSTRVEIPKFANTKCVSMDCGEMCINDAQDV